MQSTQQFATITTTATNARSLDSHHSGATPPLKQSSKKHLPLFRINRPSQPPTLSQLNSHKLNTLSTKLKEVIAYAAKPLRYTQVKEETEESLMSETLRKGPLKFQK